VNRTRERRQNYVHEGFLVEIWLEYAPMFHYELTKLLNGGLRVAIDLDLMLRVNHAEHPYNHSRR
jgi:hypothetical protein